MHFATVGADSGVGGDWEGRDLDREGEYMSFCLLNSVYIKCLPTDKVAKRST